MMIIIPLIVITALNLAILAAADLSSDLFNVGIEALSSGSAGFESASASYNRRFTFTPSAVAYPKSVEEVSKVMMMGGRSGMQVVARSGGHSYIANGLGSKNGTLVADMSNMRGLTVDSASNLVTIETGNRLGNVAVGLNEKSRAWLHGTCPYVSIGGHSAFGGFGYTSRMWGLTMDTIKAMNTVLANGTNVRVTKDKYSDLFFVTLRGAAPLIRVTTSIEVETFAVPTYSIVFSYTWDLDAQTASQALLDFQTLVTNTTDLPPEFGGGLTFSKGSSQGKLGFTIISGWYGSQGKSDGVLALFLAKLPQLATNDRTGSGTYIDSVKGLGGGWIRVDQIRLIHFTRGR
ncbi:hypothetical protein PM082_000555 [Marasmius tenuissimus]|nr:hypothetical protein PM082_000555 [Marasmius tenuissimus]